MEEDQLHEWLDASRVDSGEVSSLVKCVLVGVMKCLGDVSISEDWRNVSIEELRSRSYLRKCIKSVQFHLKAAMYLLFSCSSHSDCLEEVNVNMKTVPEKDSAEIFYLPQANDDCNQLVESFVGSFVTRAVEVADYDDDLRNSDDFKRDIERLIDNVIINIKNSLNNFVHEIGTYLTEMPSGFDSKFMDFLENSGILDDYRNDVLVFKFAGFLKGFGVLPHSFCLDPESSFASVEVRRAILNFFGDIKVQIEKFRDSVEKDPSRGEEPFCLDESDLRMFLWTIKYYVSGNDDNSSKVISPAREDGASNVVEFRARS